jgi:hypothetical protein
VNFTAYRSRFRMPYNIASKGENMWYSWNYRNIHFVSISTETDFGGSPEVRASSRTSAASDKFVVFRCSY